MTKQIGSLELNVQAGSITSEELTRAVTNKAPEKAGYTLRFSVPTNGKIPVVITYANFKSIPKS